MKHDWDESKSGRLEYGTAFQRVRFCKNCGAIQKEDDDHEWGRLVRRYWYPKVGRCSPAATKRSDDFWGDDLNKQYISKKFLDSLKGKK
jgi:hypothetical protein